MCFSFCPLAILIMDHPVVPEGARALPSGRTAASCAEIANLVPVLAIPAAQALETFCRRRRCAMCMAASGPLLPSLAIQVAITRLNYRLVPHFSSPSVPASRSGLTGSLHSTSSRSYNSIAIIGCQGVSRVILVSVFVTVYTSHPSVTDGA